MAVSSLFGFPSAYEAKQLFNDDDFSNGFSVLSQEAVNNNSVKLGTFSYNGSTVPPSWMIAQWDSGACLWADRAESDAFTITDGIS